MKFFYPTVQIGLRNVLLKNVIINSRTFCLMKMNPSNKMLESYRKQLFLG